MRRHTLIALALVSVLWSSGPARGALIVDATLRNGNYGGGLAQNTTSPNQGGPPWVLGIADGPTGVTFTPTEVDGRSDAVIYWQPGASKNSFRLNGAISMSIYVAEAIHSAMSAWGELWGGNYGRSPFHHGQSTFSAGTVPGAGNGHQFALNWTTWHDNAWHHLLDATPVILNYDQWYELGFAWGGPDHDFELSVGGRLVAAYDLLPGVTLSLEGAMGMGSGNGKKWGLGSVERPYGSNAGVTYADLKVWDEYVQLGSVIPEPATIALLGLGAVALLRKRRA